MTDGLLETLLKLERRGWDSLCAGTGDSFYGELMTEEGVMVLANGAVLGRADVVQSLEGAPAWRTYDISDARLVRLGTESVVLVYVGTGYREGLEPAFVGVMSSTYVRRGGSWRLGLYQQTPVPRGV